MSNPLFDAATKLVGNPNIKWRPDPGSLYAKHPCMRGLDGANEFKLNYWKDGSDISEPIRKFVSKKFEKIFETHSDESLESMKINMCCYQFCYFACLKAGIINEEQMNKIFCICRALRPETEFHTGNSVCAGHAFYNGITVNKFKTFNDKESGLFLESRSEQVYDKLYNYNLSDYEFFEKDDDASPGDLLLHFCYPGNNPIHYSIYAGNGEVIEHNLNEECRRGPLLQKFEDEVIQIIPQDKIASNINEFIENNYKFCDLESDRIPDPEFLKLLKAVPDYEHLITEFKISLEDETGQSQLLDSILVPVREEI